MNLLIFLDKVNMQTEPKLFTSGLEDPYVNYRNRSCIGNNNGGMGNRDYTFGFQHAADLLLRISNSFKFMTFDEEKYYIYEDPLFYPIAFNARHYIELSIKNLLEEFIFLRSFFEQNHRGNSKFKSHRFGKDEFHSDQLKKFINTHSIKKLFNKLMEVYISLDKNINNFFQENTVIKNFTEEIDKYDPNGETLRYRTTSDYEGDNLQSLEGLIDRRNFHENFKKIIDFFEEMFIKIDFDFMDFSTLTWTANLSRSDIEKIAKKLPKRDKWGSDDFGKIKKDILQEFNISANEFSEALNIIQEHREFMQYIGKEKFLDGIDKATLEKIKLFTDKSDSIGFTNDELYTLYSISEFDIYENRTEAIDNYIISSKKNNPIPSVLEVIRKIVNKDDFRDKLKKLGQSTLVNEWDALGLPFSSYWRQEYDEYIKKNSTSFFVNKIRYRGYRVRKNNGPDINRARNFRWQRKKLLQRNKRRLG